jgi:hypothetical protein
MGGELHRGSRSVMRYQDAASHFLINACPAIAAHLQHEITEAALRGRMDMPASRKHQVCSACGYITTPKSAPPLRIESKKRRVRSKASLKPERVESETRRSIVTICKMCCIQSKSWIEPSKSFKPAPSAKQHRQPEAITAPTTRRVTRKRKQAQRKKEGSLQAMLAKSKTTTPASQSSFGIGLMDFMKFGTD